MEKNTPNIDKTYNVNKKYTFPFILVLLYLFIEYGRPQTYIPILRAVRPGMIIILFLVYALFKQGKKINLQIFQTKLFIALIVLMTIHVPIASNNFHAFQQWQGLILLFIIYLSIINFVNSYEKVVTYIDTWILINVFGAVMGIMSGGRIYNAYFMSDENDFSLVMNMAIPFAYFMLLGAEGKWKRIFYLISIGIFIVGSVISLSRGGFVGLVAVLFYCWIKTPRKIFSTIMISLMVLVLAIAAPSSYWDEVKSIKEENVESGTGATRWYYWRTGIKMFLDNPILGVGQSNFPWNVEKYGDEGFYGRKHGGRVSHSLYFTLIPELGTVGIIIFILMLYYFRRNIRNVIMYGKNAHTLVDKSDKWIEINIRLNKLKFISFAVSGALIGYLISGVFISVLYYPHFWIHMALPVVLYNIAYNNFETMTDQITTISAKV